MEKGFTALGLMSGTSLDGVDAAVLRTDGRRILHHGGTAALTYSDANRALLSEAIDLARGGAFDPDNPVIRKADALITDSHHRLVKRLLDLEGLRPGDIDLIGFPGQTLLHDPQARQTLQIGDAQALADLCGIDVVADFRSRDIAEGGEGAPFAPLYHRALVETSDLSGPVAVVNLGGVGNVTYIDGETVVAFDTGPGNGLIDEWVTRHTGFAFDRGGKLAALGSIDQESLDAMLANPWFHRSPPKSLDRYDFSTAYVTNLSVENGAATLTAFTAHALARAVEHLPASPGTWVLCGGGRHNDTMVQACRDLLPGRTVLAEDLGWRGDDMEAEAFAFLAVRSYLGLPLSLPTTTGVPHPCPGGVLFQVMR